MNERKQQLSELRSYIGRVEKDITLAVQALQWDARRLLESDCTTPSGKAACGESIRRPPGYDELDVLLPDDYSDTAIKLSSADISQIIRAAAQNDPSFKMGEGDPGSRLVAQSAGRLLSTYTQDERRALYDAVVARAPPAATALDLPSLPGDEERTKPKTFLEVMAQLRDMKRRRTKYKVPTKSKNYSQVLREVIKNQMELYTGIKEEIDTNNSNYVSSASSLFHQNKEIKQERPSEPRDVLRNEIDRSKDKHSNHIKHYRQFTDHRHKNENYIEKSSYYTHSFQGKKVVKYSDRDNQYNVGRSHCESTKKNTYLDKNMQKDKHAERETRGLEGSDSQMSQYLMESHKPRDHRDYSSRKSLHHKTYSSRESRDCKDNSYRELRDQKEYSPRESRDDTNYSSHKRRDRKDHSSQSREDKDYSTRESRGFKDYSPQKIRNQSEQSSRKSRDHRNYSSRKQRDRKDHSSIESRDNKDYISRESLRNRSHSSHSSVYDGLRQPQDNKNYKSQDHRSHTPCKVTEVMEIKQVKLEPGEL